MASHGTVPEPVGSFPPSGIKVLIVGAGFGGLTAAIECTRKGHTVQLLERVPAISTLGDMYFMGLSATRFLKHWPEMKSDYEAIGLHNAWIETFQDSGKLCIPAMSVAKRLAAAGLDPSTPPGTFQLRPLVNAMLLRQAERLGVDIQFNTKIVDYFEDEEAGLGGCISDDGRRFEADLVIAADGVGSKSQRLFGGQVRARPSGRSMWRAAFPIKYLDQNSAVKEHFRMLGPNSDEPVVRPWLGPGTYAMTLTTPSSMIWLINHNASETSSESWSKTIDASEELVACTPPNTIVNLELLWRDPQPSWASPGARVLQIGDAAHSFLPAYGNGATQAIEDAVTIASCLQLGGKDKIHEAVKAHLRFRFIRTTCAQKLGFFNAELIQDTDWDEAAVDPRKAQPKLPAWVWKHDPEVYTYENYAKNVAAMRMGVWFDDAEIPPNYPPSYRYEPWTIDDIMDKMRTGLPVDLGEGDWE